MWAAPGGLRAGGFKSDWTDAADGEATCISPSKRQTGSLVPCHGENKLQELELVFIQDNGRHISTSVSHNRDKKSSLCHDVDHSRAGRRSRIDPSSASSQAG